ncbi:hypothetical protein GCM10020000_06250 [Streptomyces olivoverticillatus]
MEKPRRRDTRVPRRVPGSGDPQEIAVEARGVDVAPVIEVGVHPDPVVRQLGLDVPEPGFLVRGLVGARNALVGRVVALPVQDDEVTWLPIDLGQEMVGFGRRVVGHVGG